MMPVFPHWTARRATGRPARRWPFAGLAILMLALGLTAGCGKRGAPEPPVPERLDEYPRVYPAPETYRKN